MMRGIQSFLCRQEPSSFAMVPCFHRDKSGFPFPDQVEDKFHGNDRGGAGMTKMEVAAGFSLRMWLGIRTYSEPQPEGCGYLNLFQYQYLVRP